MPKSTDHQPDAASRDGLADLVLHAARDIGQVSSAFDAELLLSTLLGSVYAGALPDRAGALAGFTAKLRDRATATGTPSAELVAAVLDTFSGTGVPAGAQAPWQGQLGRVHCTGGYAYGDRYGDQTSYLATFGYRDESLGGPEHAVIVLVDHTLGQVKDIVITAPGTAAVDRIRQSIAAEPDAMTWFAVVDPAVVRAAAVAYLHATDQAPQLPTGDSLVANRALAVARLATLPELPPATDTAPERAAQDQEALITEFLDSPEAMLADLAAAQGARRESVLYCLGLVVTFAASRASDALRWSPLAVEAFLLEWVHGNAILDGDDVRTLPEVLAAWVAWSGRRIDLPDAALKRTFTQVAAVRPEFERLCASGERQSPAAAAMAQLVADGVDLADPTAVDAWLARYNARTDQS